MATHRNLLGILVILALGVALVACTSASAAQNGNAGQADTGEISKISSPPQGQTPAVNTNDTPVRTQAQHPQAVEQPVEKVDAPTDQDRHFVFPTIEELTNQGVLSEENTQIRQRTPYAWGWGEFHGLNDLYQTVENEQFAAITGGRVLEDVTRVIMLNPTLPLRDRPPAVPYDKETQEVLLWLAEHLFDHSQVIGGLPVKRTIYSIRVDPDYSVRPEVVTRDIRVGKTRYEERKLLTFSSIVSITFEGENGQETARLQVQDALPIHLQQGGDDFRLRKIN